MNTDAPSDGVPNDTRQKLIELKEIDKSIAIFGDVKSVKLWKT